MDYYVIVVVIVGWLRFFSYFLVIRKISKLIMTLVKMLFDTLAFIFLVSCYMIIATTVFTTLFSNANPEKYGEVIVTMRTLYDAFIGSYDYEVPDNVLMSFSILMMVHVFVANIFLLNYLVAILSTVYEAMFEGGEFQYKSKKYKFIEKYSVAFLDPNGYYEIVIHPPPLNYFTFFILPFLIKPNLMKSASKVYSKLNYWFENIFYFMYFLGYELLMVPIVYMTVMVNIFKMSSFK